MDKYAQPKMDRLERLSSSLVLVFCLTLLMVAWSTAGTFNETNQNVQTVGQGATAPPVISGGGGGGLGSSLNLHLMGRFNGLFSSRDTSTNTVKHLGFGDSMLWNSWDDSAQAVMQNTLANLWGLQCANYEAPDCLLNYSYTGGAALVQPSSSASDWTNRYWPGNYWSLPHGSTMTVNNYNASDGNIICNGLEVFYVAGTGTNIVVQASYDGGAFNTIATITTSTNLGYPVVRKKWVDLGNYSIKNAQWKLVSTGTNYVCMVCPNFSINRTYSKLSSYFVGKGGIGLDCFMSLPTNILASAFGAIEPDLFSFHMKHESATTADRLNALLGYVRAANTNCEILLFGTPPAIGAAYSAYITYNPWLAAYAASNNCMYVDLASQIPSTAYMMTNGWYQSSDGIHPTAAAYDAMLRPFFSYWGWGRPVCPQQVGTRIDRLGLGDYASTDHHVPLQLITSKTGGRVDIYMEDNSPIWSLRHEAQQMLYSDGDNVGLAAKLPNGEIWFANGQLYGMHSGSETVSNRVAIVTRSGGFYVGTNVPSGYVTNVPYGRIQADEKIYGAAGFSTISGGNWTAGITTNLTCIRPGPVTNTLTFIGGILTGVQ